MKNQKTVLSVSVYCAAILLLNSCGPPQAEIDAAAPAALSATQIAQGPTSMPTATAAPTQIPPTATQTPTQMPTATQTATHTPIPPTATPTATLIPPTATPAPTPTLEPLPGAFPEGIVVEFRGNGCTVSGPTELPAGDVTFIVTNRSGGAGSLYVSYLLDGRTFQEQVDIQKVPGRHWQKPSYVLYAHIVDQWRNESRDEMYYTWSLEEGVGEVMVYLGTTIPPGMWLCAPRWVVEAPSE